MPDEEELKEWKRVARKKRREAKQRQEELQANTRKIANRICDRLVYDPTFTFLLPTNWDDPLKDA